MITLVLFLASSPATAAEPARRVEVTPGAQARLRRGVAWTGFTAGEGRGWTARFDARTGTIQRAWGPGIPLGDVRTAAEAERAVRAFLARHPGLPGVPAADLRLRSANYLPRRDTWYVDFDRTLGGVPLWRAGASARIVGGRLVMLGLDTHPGARVSPVPAATQLVLAIDRGPAIDYRPAIEVTHTTQVPPARWTTFVDAETGATLASYDALPHLEGVMTAAHDARYPGDAGATSAVPHQALAGSAGGVATTGFDGSFELDDAETWTASFTGPYLSVQNGAGDEGVLLIGGAEPRWTDLAADVAEIDAWIFQSRVRGFAERFAPEVGLHERQLVVTVNASVTCNAFFDGDIVLGIEGDGCSNAGRIYDVHVHEWGHALHTASILGGVLDITFGEGLGDLLAALHTLDPSIAPYWYTDGRPLREIASDKVYPGDVTGQAHEDGSIFAGAAWDLLALLQERYGEGPDVLGTAWEVSAQLLADAAKDGPTLLTAFDAYMLADDDDADLGNGTPHLCEIVEAFGRHGLGPLGEAWPATIVVDEVPNVAADTTVVVTGRIEPMAPGCVDVLVDRVDVEWSADWGRSWTTVSATLDASTFSAELPACWDQSITAYRAVARDASGSELGASSGSARAPTFFCGALELLSCEDFEAGDGGYTHEVLSGRGVGADDWALGTPRGLAGDPSSAASGANAWGNDLGVYPDDGAYRDGVSNRLSTPTLDLDDRRRLVVQFHRSLALADGDYATVDLPDGQAWLVDDAAQDPAWTQTTLATGLSGDDDGGVNSAALAWTLTTDNAESAGGWTVDDVCFYLAELLPVPTPSEAEWPDDEESAVSASEPPCTCAGGSRSTALGGVLAAAVAAIGRRRSSAQKAERPGSGTRAAYRP